VTPVRDHQPDRVHLRAYYVALATAALVTLGVVGVATLVLPSFLPVFRRATDTPLARDARAPEPHLQVDPVRELAAQRAAEQARLTSYGWVDRQHGIAHVPIEVATRLLVEHP
jgi:hypothetical protein